MSDIATYDLAIVGGGPAGCSAAYYASKRGLKTILFEKRKYPRDKPCGGALSGRAIPYLGKMAIRAINCKVKEIRIFSPKLKFFTNTEEHGYFIIREKFDAAMAEDARIAGATIRENAKVLKILQEKNLSKIITKEESVYSKTVILADGIYSKLTYQLGFREHWSDEFLAACVVSETPVPLSEVNMKNTCLMIFFGVVPKGYGWYFVKEGSINIGIGATYKDVKQLGPRNVYKKFVKQLRRLEFIPSDLTLNVAKRWPLVFKQPSPHSVHGNALLLGDTTGFVSPVTGEGLYYCLKGGELAVKAITGYIQKGKPLDDYQRMWLKSFGRDLSKYAMLIQSQLYGAPWRTEFVVNLAMYDAEMANIITKMLVGEYSYRRFLQKALIRLPVALWKTYSPLKRYENLKSLKVIHPNPIR